QRCEQHRRGQRYRASIGADQRYRASIGADR
ncbi:MAG: hypothetical protein ACI8UD_001025, partial [Planctomycetota bacterium]